MKSKKEKRDVYSWLRDPSMKALEGDERLDKHLTFPRTVITSHFFGKRWRLLENGKEIFNVESRPELRPVFDRLVQALLQEKILIERLRESVDRPMTAGAGRPNTLTRLVLEEATKLLGKDIKTKASLATLLQKAVIKAIRARATEADFEALARKDTPISLKHVRNVLNSAAETYPGASLADAVKCLLGHTKAKKAK